MVKIKSEAVIKKTTRPNGTVRETISFTGVSRTKQADLKECDVNNIVSKYIQTGNLTFLQKTQPEYRDVSGIEDYKTSMEIVIRTKEQFKQLNSNIRNKFINDPRKFLEYMENPDNLEESYKLGLREKPEKETPVEVVVKETTAKPASASPLGNEGEVVTKKPDKPATA